ncbi:hypothetical protein QUA56_10840, partial [Microcoleus sp. N3A4]|uniref:hypothetical protein n=1 Tax=Microcoleus sp. N3A4 TaxID=3055379 RepID=UPI002FD0CA55
DSLESYPKVLSMGNSVQELRYSFQPRSLAGWVQFNNCVNPCHCFIYFDYSCCQSVDVKSPALVGKGKSAIDFEESLQGIRVKRSYPVGNRP